MKRYAIILWWIKTTNLKTKNWRIKQQYNWNRKKKRWSKVTTLIDTARHEHKKQNSTNPSISRWISQREDTRIMNKKERYITKKKVKSIDAKKNSLRSKNAKKGTSFNLVSVSRKCVNMSCKLKILSWNKQSGLYMLEIEKNLRCQSTE